MSRQMILTDVTIIGGGASGLAAAIAIKQLDANLSVCIIEKNNRVGKKILATGNGRCNLGNINFKQMNRYHGSCTKYVPQVFNHSSDTIDFFRKLGLCCRCDNSGRIYPNSNQSSSVLDALRLTIEQLGVKVYCNTIVNEFSRTNIGFLIQTNTFDVQSRAVIVACGGKASPKTGSNGDFIFFLKKMGHSLTNMKPALVPFLTKQELIRSLKGIRVHVSVSALDEKKMVIAKEVGEMQFTDRTISGICVMNLSANTEPTIKWISCNFLPEYTHEQTINLLWELYALRAQWRLDDWLTGLFPKKLAMFLIRTSEISLPFDSFVYQLTPSALERVSVMLQNCCFPVISRGSWQEAQVTMGGVSADEIENTLQSRILKGLFFSGEILDLHGDCGGYNLEWAWHSGQYAAKNAVIYVQKEKGEWHD